jgi:hypothetical protein
MKKYKVIIILAALIIIGGGLISWQYFRSLNIGTNVEEYSYISITSPTKDNNWTTDYIYEIKWASEGIDEVGIELWLSNQDGSFNTSRPIATVPASDGSYSWEIPSDLLSAYAYQIVLIGDLSKAPPAGVDQAESDYFSIENKKTINWDTYRNEKYGFEIRHPRGLDKEELGTYTGDTVSLVYLGFLELFGGIGIDVKDNTEGKSLRSLLFVDSGPCEVESEGIASIRIACNTESEYSIISAFANNDKVYIISYAAFDYVDVHNMSEAVSGELEVYNQMISTFKFLTQESSIVIISPNGGEQLVLGQPYNIEWSSQRASLYINIILNGYDQAVKEIDIDFGKNYIADSVGNTNSYQWTPTAEFLDKFSLNPAKYKIKITPSRGTLGFGEDYQGESEYYFTIGNIGSK